MKFNPEDTVLKYKTDESDEWVSVENVKTKFAEFEKASATSTDHVKESMIKQSGTFEIQPIDVACLDAYKETVFNTKEYKAECLDRLNTVSVMLSVLLEHHPLIQSTNNIEKIKSINKILMEIYQEVGAIEC